jgi:hypothetical protein
MSDNEGKNTDQHTFTIFAAYSCYRCTKHFAARQHCQGNKPLPFHGTNKHVYIVTATHTHQQQYKGKVFLRFYGKYTYANTPKCAVVKILCVLLRYWEAARSGIRLLRCQCWPSSRTGLMRWNFQPHTDWTAGIRSATYLEIRLLVCDFQNCRDLAIEERLLSWLCWLLCHYNITINMFTNYVSGKWFLTLNTNLQVFWDK